MGFWMLVWFASIVIAVVVGGNRGSPVGGFLLGFFLGPIGALASFGLRSMKDSKCPKCREWIKQDATRCPRCQSDLAADWAKTA